MQGFITKDTSSIEGISFFLKKVVYESNIDSIDIDNIHIEYLGEKIFQHYDIIEHNFIFKKRNSQYLNIDLYIPTTFSMHIYKNRKDRSIKSIEDFLLLYIDIISKSIKDTYSKTNMKSYLFTEKSKNIGLVDNIYKQNIFKIDFEIYNKIETIYFNIDMYQFFSHRISE